MLSLTFSPDRPLADQIVTLSGSNADRLRFGARKQDGIDMYVAERNARTDDLGRFTFADVAPGDYRVRTQHRGMRT